MTVREWLASRTSAAPSALRSRLLELLENGANAPADQVTPVLIEAARATVHGLLEAGRFGREGALDLLAADAFMTYAYEHAAERAWDVPALEAAALQGAARIALLVPRS